MQQVINITVQVTINAPVEKVWEVFTRPEHIKNWNSASPDWHTPNAENDLAPGGVFVYRMEAKNGSSGFDFNGVYDTVKTNELIAYTLGDGRKVSVTFIPDELNTKVTETFEAENTNPAEMQKEGWHAILNSFKAYTELL